MTIGHIIRFAKEEDVLAPIKTSVAAISLIAGLLMSAPVLAWSVPGCINLPEYERALATLRGMASACGMSVEEASRIVAAQGNKPGGLLGRLLSVPPQPAAGPTPSSPPEPSSGVHSYRR